MHPPHGPLPQRQPRILLRERRLGMIDLAVGPFPTLPQAVRRRRLWLDGYTSLIRKAHPRLGPTPSLAAFRNERHVLIAREETHVHQGAERALLAVLPPAHVVLRDRALTGSRNRAPRDRPSPMSRQIHLKPFAMTVNRLPASAK